MSMKVEILRKKQKASKVNKNRKIKKICYITIDRRKKRKNNKKHWGRIVKGKQKTFFKFLQHVHQEIQNSLSSVSPLNSHSTYASLLVHSNNIHVYHLGEFFFCHNFEIYFFAFVPQAIHHCIYIL